MKYLAALLFIAGCSAEYAFVQSDVGCSSDSECGPDFSCFKNKCLEVRPGMVPEVDVEVTPPSTALATRTHFLAQRIDTNLTTDLVLPTPVVFGAVQVLDVNAAPIGARLTFRGKDRIPTREVDTQLLLERSRTSGVKLLPGLYNVRVLPIDAMLYPGIEIEDFEVRPGPAVARRELAVPARYRTLTGEVTRRTSNQHKIAGVKVQATSIGSGLPSTEAVTDMDGRFSISLPETPDTTFVLTAEPRQEGGPFWSFSQTITFASQGQRAIAIGLEETSADVRGKVRLRVLGVGPRGPMPVAQARVVLTATTGLDYRAFTVQAMSNAEGYLPEIELLAASYRATIEPPTDSHFQPAETRLALGVLNNGLMVDKQLELAPKIPVTGVVQSGLGQPVASATVLFEPESGSPRSASATTDINGAYALALDAGSYVVTITPTANSRVSEALPVHIARAIVAAGATSVDIPPFALDTGTLFEARVLTADRAPLARAVVEVFSRIVGRPISLGRAISDDEGRVSLIVPSVPAP